MNAPRYSLFKRSNQIYYIRKLVGKNESWKSTSCRDKRSAQKYLNAYLTSLDEDRAEADSIQPYPFKKFSREFLEFAKFAMRPKTVQIYIRVFQYCEKYFGNIDLNRLTPKHWDQYMRMRGVEISPTSLHIEMRALRAAINKAVRWGSIKSSPFQGADNVKVVLHPPKYFTREEFHTLLSLIKERWLHDSVIFSVATGIRRGELINLKWSDIDFNRNIIIIQSDQHYTVKAGKRRNVPLSEAALEIVNQQVKIEGIPYVFTVKHKQIYGNWMSGLFRRYVRQAGLYEKKLHWHNLRSSFASWLVESGVSIFSVSRLLGHTSVTMTEKHYAHLAPEGLHHEVEKISIGNLEFTPPPKDSLVAS